MEFDYVGVIVGNDLQFDSETLTYEVDWQSYKDRNGKKGLKDDPESLSQLVRNIYKTLMTRAMKGCYVYFCDKNVEKYFRDRLAQADTLQKREGIVPPAFQFKVIDNVNDSEKFKTHLPVYSLKAAATAFGKEEFVEQEGWMNVDDSKKLNKDMFVAQVVGRSMEPTIKDGSFCIFRLERGGSRNGKVVLVESRQVADPESNQTFTVKRYHSEKNFCPDGTWKHKKIILSPDNKEFESIELKNIDPQDFRVVAEFVGEVGVV